MTASSKFWQGKRVLLTGHTGFKGAWMAFWLTKLGAKVTGISLPPSSEPNLFSLINLSRSTESHFLDIRDAEAVEALIKKAEPELVFHLAAQALVRPSYLDPINTFSTNVMGTANVLNALRKLDSVKSVVAITTDKVYKNLEHYYPYRETDALGGYDPYSASKAACEIVISSYRDSYLSEQGVAVSSARAGNVVGGGDWSVDRLIPDAVRSWDANTTLDIRRPNAVRPWQHVLEPINSYLKLAERTFEEHSLAGAYNFGPSTDEAATVRTVIEMARQIYGVGDVSWGDGNEGPHEAGLLSLEIAKARELLGIAPRWNLEKTIAHTMRWYQQFKSGKAPSELCEADIEAFTSAKVS